MSDRETIAELEAENKRLSELVAKYPAMADRIEELEAENYRLRETVRKRHF